MTSEDLVKVKLDSALVQTQLTILQNIIQRMAGNSANCKTWCVTLVSAILVLLVDKKLTEYACITLLPVIAFAALDIYYLALEKAFRNLYNQFVSKLHDGELVASDFQMQMPEANMLSLRRQALNSFSVFGFYMLLIIMIFVTNLVAIR